MLANNLLKLPPSLKNNEIAHKIKSYMDMLGSSSGYFSCILFEKEGKLYFLKKDKDFPFISFDWTIYTLMRVRAKTIITSGPTLRRQKWVYQDSRGTFGKQQLESIYKDNVVEPVNLIVFTKKMNDEEIKSMISHKYFKFVPMNDVRSPKNQTQHHTFKQIADRVNELKLGPTIYENGQQTLAPSLQQVKEGQENFTEMIIISKYKGDMPQKYIGDEYNMKILIRDFDKVWESQQVKTETQLAGQNQQKSARLQFTVYLRKKKSQTKKQ